MKKSGKINLAWALALSVPLGLGFAGSTKAQTVNWQVGHVLPALHWTVADHIAMSKTWEKATNGKLKLNVLPSEASGVKGPDILSSTTENLLQIGAAFGSRVAGQERVLEMFDLPFFVPFDVDFRVKLWDALFDDYASLLEKKFDVWLLGYSQLLPRQLYTKQLVEKVGDIKGLKVRSIGPADSAFTRSLGGVATTTNFGEVYTTIQQGTNDGIWTTHGGALAMKFQEVAPNVYITNNAGPTVFTVISKKALAALPADVRKFVMSQRDVYKKRRVETWKKFGDKVFAILKKKGIKVHAVKAADQAAMDKLAKPIIEKWASRLSPETKPLYLKAKKMIDEFKASKK